MQTVFPLPRWFPREPYESPPGCLLRLAECNGLPGTSVVRLMTGLAVHRIKTGKDLEDLAAVLHCDIKKLRRNATFEKGKSLADVKAARLTRDYDGRYSQPTWTGDMFVESVYKSLKPAPSQGSR